MCQGITGRGAFLKTIIDVGKTFHPNLAESLSAKITLLPGDCVFNANDRVDRKVMMVGKGVLEIVSNGISKGCLYPGDIVTGKGWLATVSDESEHTSK